MANKRKRSTTGRGTTSFVVAVLTEAYRRAALAAEARGWGPAELRARHRAALLAVLSSRAAYR